MNDQWYYRTLGQEFGPVKADALLQLIESGVIGQGDEVKEGCGRWTELCSSPGMVDPDHPHARSPNRPKVPESSRQSNKSIRDALAQCREYLHDRDLRLARLSSSRARRLREFQLPALDRLIRVNVEFISDVIATVIRWGADLIWPLIRSKLVWLAAAILVTSWFAIATAGTMLTRREAYDAISEMVQELQTLRKQEASPKTLDEFANRSRAELDWIVPKLESSANSAEPESLQLLWVARDYLPLMTDDALGQQSDAERKIRIHLNRAADALDRKDSHPWALDSAVIALAVVDVVLLVFATWWWKRGS